MKHTELYCGTNLETVENLKIRDAIYQAQCFTFNIAKEIAGVFKNNSSQGIALKSNDIMAATMQPPFCLRTVKKYRTQEAQEFRDAVAKATRKIRAEQR